MKASRISLLPLAFVCLGTACSDVVDPLDGEGSVSLDLVFADPVPVVSAGVGGPLANTRALPPLDQVDVVLSGPVDTLVTLTQTATAFEGTITGLRTGSYAVVVVGRGGGRVTYYGRNPSVQVSAGVTTTAPITFASFVSTIDPVTPTTTQFAQVITFAAVSSANSYTVEVDRTADFSQPSSFTTSGTTALVTVFEVGSYFVRVRAANANVSSNESSFSNVESWNVVADSTSGSDAGTALNLGVRSAAAGSYAGFNVFPNTDEDWFALTLAAGDEVTAAVKTTSLSPPSGLDPTLRLVGPGGATVAVNDDNGGGVESFLAGTIPSAGTYHLVVGSSGQGSVGHYQLVVTHFAPVASVIVDPASATVQPGGTIQLSARTVDGAGVELTDRTVVWSSADPTVATVTGNGVVTGVKVGTVNVRASSEGVVGVASITVSANVLTVTPARDTLTSLGDSVQLTATGGVAAVSWATSNGNVAAVDANGLVTAVGNGTATITADDGSIQGTAVIVVQQKAVSILTNQPVGGFAGQVMNPDPSASIVDARLNALLNQNITFTVVGGGGTLGGNQTIQVPTDQFGVARTPWTLGIAPNQRLEVRGAGLVDTLVVSAYFGGQGTPLIDGFVDVNEWAGSWCVTRNLDVPEGGTTPGRMCLMNDALNLYVMVRFDRAFDPNSAMTTNFDTNGSGIIDPGDVYSFVVQQNGLTTRQEDGHWYDNAFDAQCEVGMTCPAADTTHGGTEDGFFQGSNDGVETAFEFEIPLSSGDPLDISVAAGALIDMNGVLRIWDAATGTTTSTVQGFPSSGLLRVRIF